jgi:RNase P/RNase MRP subunit p29
VRKSGFTPKETRIVVRGEVVTEGKTTLKVTGTADVYELASNPKNQEALEELRREAGKTVTVEGTLQPPKEVKARVPLVVDALKR